MHSKIMSLLFNGLLAASVACDLPAQAQTTPAGPVRNIGNVVSVTAREQQLTILTEQASAELTVYSPSVIRVRIDKRSLAEDLSYAVVSKPYSTRVNMIQGKTEIVVKTDSLEVRISRTPFRISFYTLDGRVINEDEPGLTTSWVGEEVTTYKKLYPDERFIGLGEKTGKLDRRGQGYTNWNTDAFGYGINQDPIYSTIPFYIGIHGGLCYGIFLDNTWQTDFNFGASNNRFSSFSAQGGEMNYYFIYHPTVSDIITAYTGLTGRMPLPPLWSLGYQQNRYSYYPETEVLRIAQTLREKKIPADGITLDIHYMDHYKLFTWDKDRFPDPAGMIGKLDEMGFKVTTIVDPGIKVEKGYDAYESGIRKDIFVKYADGGNFSAQVWPGWCHFPDFTNKKAREWWAEQLKGPFKAGVRGIWNDMNEIATWGQKLPSNILYEYEGRKASNREAHNVYGMQMVRASYDGACKEMNKRPFLLSRAGYAGLQRYSAMWTGDNVSSDEHMLLGVRLLNSLGVSGIPFTGMDIGGFTGNPGSKLYARWIQVGAFIPYFRNHTAVNSRSSEPWAYGEEVLEIARNFISLRYRLMPYLYGAFYEATQSGLPVMRSLAIDYTHDPHIYEPAYQNQFLFGKAFLVAPFESTRDFGRLYFPAGDWYDLYTDEPEKGGREKIVPLSVARLPVYVKAGSIVPMQSQVQSTVEKPADTLELHIYKGDTGSSMVYYEDDGESFDYRQGTYYRRRISYDPQDRKIQLQPAEGSFVTHFKRIKLVLHGFAGTDTLRRDGETRQLLDDSVMVIRPVSRFDPQGGANAPELAHVKVAIIDNESGGMEWRY